MTANLLYVIKFATPKYDPLEGKSRFELFLARNNAFYVRCPMGHSMSHITEEALGYQRLKVPCGLEALVHGTGKEGLKGILLDEMLRPGGVSKDRKCLHFLSPIYPATAALWQACVTKVMCTFISIPTKLSANSLWQFGRYRRT